jgi:hypothetical protein
MTTLNNTHTMHIIQRINGDVPCVVTPNHGRLARAFGVAEIDFLGRPKNGYGVAHELGIEHTQQNLLQSLRNHS